MGTVVCAAAVPHVLYPDDRGETMDPEVEREAFLRWGAWRLNALGGSLDFLIVLPGVGLH